MRFGEKHIRTKWDPIVASIIVSNLNDNSVLNTCSNSRRRKWKVSLNSIVMSIFHIKYSLYYKKSFSLQSEARKLLDKLQLGEWLRQIQARYWILYKLNNPRVERDAKLRRLKPPLEPALYPPRSLSVPNFTLLFCAIVGISKLFLSTFYTHVCNKQSLDKILLRAW